MRRFATTLVIFLAAGAAFAQGRQGYYRQPALNRNTIVFCAEGDLWKVGADGGVASRLTTHPATEGTPRISPDGKWLAFGAQYDGQQDAYVMPIDGGLPKRLTYDGFMGRSGADIAGWRAGDGHAQVIISTAKYSGLPDRRLILVDADSGARSLVPLSQAAEGVYDDTGKTIFFTRLAFQGSQTKRYQGGTAQNLWKFTEGQPEAVPLTADYAGTSAQPMWWNGRLYFVSDRDGTMEVWSMTPDAKGLQQETNHTGEAERLLDVRGASMDSGGSGRIVYQLGADLWVYDPARHTDARITITLPSDFDQEREHWITKPFEYLSAAHVSPSGDRAVLTARGQVFVAPKEPGRLVEVTRKDGVRFRDARFMPDGKTILLLSDQSGEVEFWTAPANGVGELAQLTSDGEVLRWEGIPSPDSKLIAHHDKNQKLWIFDVGAKTDKKIDTNEWDNFQSVRWSPDSRYLAYVNIAENLNHVVRIYDTQTGATIQATTDRFDSNWCAWSPDCKWLYVLSDRAIESVVASPWGPMAPEPFFDKPTTLFAVSLKPGERWPFQPSDELYEASKSEKKDTEKKEPPKEPEKTGPDTAKPAEETKPGVQPDAKAEPKPDAKTDEAKDKAPKVELVAEGLAARLFEVPVDNGNYSEIAVGEKKLYWLSREAGRGEKATLMSVDIANKDIEPKAIAKDIDSYELSADAKNLLVRKGETIAIIPADSGPGADLSKGKVDLSGWSFPLTPREEWRQMFVESWRLERDYFYDTGMHKVDWKGVLNRYLPLVDRVATRAELSDLIMQMVGELSTLHTFVYGGDMRTGPEKIGTATLGALLDRDPAGGFKVTHIYKSDPDYPGQRSPLAAPGVEVHEGDMITRVNGRAASDVADIAELLRQKAGRQVLLSVRPAGGAEERSVIVTPISTGADADLRYHEWEYTRRLAVEDLGKGDIGYLHLRAMGTDNISEFARGYYPVFNRKGLIIDVRHNRGGNIDSWILSRLLRKAWFFWQPRVGEPFWNMQYAFRGHVVVLCDEFTASDGEAFSEGIKRLGIGKVIGKRTWGGEIWLSSSNTLVDGGIATAAEIGVYGPEGIWLVEGRGVEPDIEVDNPPHSTFAGEDAQLKAAVEYLQKKIAAEPVVVPKAPAHPDKSFKGPGGNAR